MGQKYCGSLGFVLFVALAACHGTLEQDSTGGPGGPGANSGVDAGSEPAGDSPDATPVSEVACDDPVPTNEDGEHNPGTDCLACHSPNGEGPTFSIGGTLYDGVASNTPVAGATIRFTDANGLDHAMISALNGNFWTEDPVAFPITVSASSCPDTRPMNAPVQEAGGSCALGGCHTAQFRVHLP
jgi:hypothetical protein